MGKILVGTASWADKSLVDSGKYYPPQVKTPADRLRFYASEFAMVEVNTTYYGLPSAETVAAWDERTPPGFLFNVKSFRLFTGHQTLPKVLPKDIREALGSEPGKNVYYKDVPGELRQELWRRMREVVEPLRRAGKFGAWHFQFPPWMAFHPENFDHLRECRQQLTGDRVAVEFRNPSWFTPDHQERTLAFERELEMAHVVVDAPPDVSQRVPTVWEVTSSQLAVLRLHGRNRETWNKKGLKASSDRFNYDYSRDELGDMTDSIRELSDRVEQLDIVFNNNYEDQGQRNAKTLRKLLQ